MSSRVLAKCDALDGATDGLIQDQAACAAAFVPATDLVTCTGSLTTALACRRHKRLCWRRSSVAPRMRAATSLYADFPGMPASTTRTGAVGRSAAPTTSTTGAATGASQAISIGAYSLPTVFISPGTVINGDSVLTGSANALAFMRSVRTLLVTSGLVDPESIYATSGIFTTPSMSKTQRGVGFMSGNSLNYDRPTQPRFRADRRPRHQ